MKNTGFPICPLVFLQRKRLGFSLTRVTTQLLMVSNTAKGNFLFVEQSKIHLTVVQMNVYSRSSRKRPPRKFENVVVARAGRLRE